MIGDIAYRCIKLNPHLGGDAARQTRGVVLIDEVDMHLHPRWQQIILTQLREVFPQIQFVITTHSPQVLTSVPSECIRILKDNKVYSAPPGTEGSEPERMLRQVLGLDEV
ncbi:AAA family ATPase, partial [Escherichia coli]|uniref:AAA family ATPase n=2 Tax=Gammaproteobacteria TaxID=1236 RepID=UPI00202BB1A4